MQSWQLHACIPITRISVALLLASLILASQLQKACKKNMSHKEVNVSCVLTVAKRSLDSYILEGLLKSKVSPRRAASFAHLSFVSIRLVSRLSQHYILKAKT